MITENEPGAQVRPLTKKQKDFVTAFVACSNGTQAAVEAGYPPGPSSRNIAFENLKKPAIIKAIKELSDPIDNARIATATERREFWTAAMQDTSLAMRDRLKASELLGKSHGDFIERREIIKRTVDQMDREELLQYKISLEEKRAVVLQMKTRAIPKLETAPDSV